MPYLPHRSQPEGLAKHGLSDLVIAWRPVVPCRAAVTMVGTARWAETAGSILSRLQWHNHGPDDGRAQGVQSAFCLAYGIGLGLYSDERVLLLTGVG